MAIHTEKSRPIGKTEYKKRVLKLRQALLASQQALRAKPDFPVILLFAGVDTAGKGETANLLNEWMDPRWLVTRAYERPSEAEAERPRFWRYWRDLPAKGRIGLFLYAWYSHPVLEQTHNGKTIREQHIRHIINFEKLLTDDGALIIKFWLHLSREEQLQHLQTMQIDPLLRWRVTQQDWDRWHNYERFIDTAKQIIERTDKDQARWFAVSGYEPHYRNLKIGEILRDALQARLQKKPDPRPGKRKIKSGGSRTAKPLDQLKPNKTYPKKYYDAKLRHYQAQINQYHHEARRRGLTTVLVFEGWDAAGKGGAIRRISAALDARHYAVTPIAAPTDEEKAHHYLWRFWHHIPRSGTILIFDRSWYGRVLVERVEGFAETHEWQRAYGEINDFEAQLVEHGIVFIKYWLHIGKEKQLERFQGRENTAHKRWKLTPEDWRNRDQWTLYEQAVNDMIRHTDTETAPWTLVEANNKRYARIKVLRTLCDKLEQVLP